MSLRSPASEKTDEQQGMKLFIFSEPSMLLDAIDASSRGRRGSCATIGNFDGVHVGHRALLERVRCHAAADRLFSFVVTFWPHPLQVLCPSRGPGLIVSRSRKLGLLRERQVDAVLEIPFTLELAALSPRDFVMRYLVPLRLRHLVIGHDFTLGKNRAGNCDVLSSLGREAGFGVERLSPVTMDGEIVSSTRIRRCLNAGDVQGVAGMRGNPHRVEGRIRKAYRQTDGLALAEVEVPDILLPRQGSYAGEVRWGDGACKALICIGGGIFGNARGKMLSVLFDAESIHSGKMEFSFLQRIGEDSGENGTVQSSRLIQYMTCALPASADLTRDEQVPYGGLE